MQAKATTAPPTDALPWYRRAFDELYPLLYPHRDDASARREIAALIKTLNVPQGTLTLDIACGAGRHLRAMLDAGLDAYGVDLSGPLLARAIGERELAGRVIQTDVRRLPFANQFDFATNLFTSFGYFPNDAQNAAAMARMTGVLKPGGRFVIDHAHEPWVLAHLVEHDRRELAGLTVESRRWIEDGRMKKDMMITDRRSRTEVIHENVQLFSLDKMSDLLGRCGIQVDGVFGDFDGSPLTAESSRMICTGNHA